MGEIELYPSTYLREWTRWLENIEDWCISRQLWWGHRIPAYLVSFEGELQDENNSFWVTGRDEQEVKDKVCSNGKAFSLRQDEDVLDTWFSSALLPLSAFEWTSDSEFESPFYPLSVMET